VLSRLFMSSSPEPDYDELPHNHTVISARCDYAICYVLASSASGDRLNNRTTKGKHEVCNSPPNTENSKIQEAKNTLSSDAQNALGKMDNLTQLNSKTSPERNEGRLKDLQVQKTEKNIPGTVDKATTTVSIAARKPFKLPHEAEAKFTTVIDDNFTRLENVINENIFPQFTQIMQLLEKEGLEPDRLAMVSTLLQKSTALCWR